MKKVVFFTAKPNEDSFLNGDRLSTDEKRPPHGIGFLISILRSSREKYDITFIDRYCEDESWDSKDFEDYDFAGVYCNSICSNDFFSVINKLKCKNIAVGGPHVSLFPESFATTKVNTLVIGEAENYIEEIISGELTGLIKANRLQNEELDELPRFPWDFFYEKYKSQYIWTSPFTSVSPVLTLNTSRGCPYSCSFCSVKKIWGRKYTMMSAERVFDDVLYVRSLGAKGLYFREDNFTVNKDRIKKFCEKMIKYSLNMQWSCETRVDTVDYETMKLMKDSGCTGFYIGVEHLTNKMLQEFNKGITVDQIVQFFDWANKLNIKTAASLIVEHPKETSEDIIECNKILKIIRPTMVWKNRYRANG